MSHRPGTTRPALAALVAAAVAAPLAAQAPACADPEPLATATARGRALAAYDRAAWHGTDVVAALAPPGGRDHAVRGA